MQIISGGQTGIDKLGLKVAKRLGIITGGTAPKDFRTEDGSDYSLRDEFGLKESNSYDYGIRTLVNVQDAECTVLFGNMKSVGSQKTILYCQQNFKPYIENPTVAQLTQWLRHYNPAILNVAGNRGSKLTVKQLEDYEFILLNSLSYHIN